MSNPVPNSIALVNIATGADILSSDHRTNYAAVQAAINDLITALSGGVSGQVLQAASSSAVVWAGGSYLAPPVKYGTLIDIVSSTTETDILQAAGYAIPAGTLGANGCARVTLTGDYINNTGGAVDGPRIKITLGGTTLYQNAVAGITWATSAGRRAIRIQFEIQNLGLANSQDLSGYIAASGTDSPTTGIGSTADGGGSSNPLAAGVSMVIPIGTSAPTALDTASAQTLRVTATLSSSSASHQLRIRKSVIEFI